MHLRPPLQRFMRHAARMSSFSGAGYADGGGDGKGGGGNGGEGGARGGGGGGVQLSNFSSRWAAALLGNLSGRRGSLEGSQRGSSHYLGTKVGKGMELVSWLSLVRRVRRVSHHGWCLYARVQLGAPPPALPLQHMSQLPSMGRDRNTGSDRDSDKEREKERDPSNERGSDRALAALLAAGHGGRREC